MQKYLLIIVQSNKQGVEMIKHVLQALMIIGISTPIALLGAEEKFRIANKSSDKLHIKLTYEKLSEKPGSLISHNHHLAANSIHTLPAGVTYSENHPAIYDLVRIEIMKGAHPITSIRVNRILQRFLASGDVIVAIEKDKGDAYELVLALTDKMHPTAHFDYEGFSATLGNIPLRHFKKGEEEVKSKRSAAHKDLPTAPGGPRASKKS